MACGRPRVTPLRNPFVETLVRKLATRVPSMPGCLGDGFVLRVCSRPRIKTDDTNAEMMCKRGREVNPQRPHYSFGDHVPGQFGRGSATLSQDGARHQALAEPAHEVDFTHCFTQPPEDGCSGRAGKDVAVCPLVKRDEDEEERSSRALCPAPLDGKKMPERRLVVSLSSRSARKPGVTGTRFGHHGFPAAVLFINQASNSHAGL
jgi:hypothetical protein